MNASRLVNVFVVNELCNSISAVRLVTLSFPRIFKILPLQSLIFLSLITSQFKQNPDCSDAVTKFTDLHSVT